MTPPSQPDPHADSLREEWDMERLMAAFTPCVRQEEQRLHPQWAPVVQKVKMAAALLRQHQNRTGLPGTGTVEYADWCFYPEKDGSSISRLAIHADLIPARSAADRQTRSRMLDELEQALQPLLHTTTVSDHTLTVLIPAASQP